MSQDRERILNSGLAAKGKVDLTLHLHKARANVVRFKTYRTESVIAHKSFFLIPMFIKLGYAGIRRHGVKAKPIKQGNTVRPGRGHLATVRITRVQPKGDSAAEPPRRPGPADAPVTAQNPRT